jgi:hypothetical protein
MTSEEYKWHINLVKSRYSKFKLTVEQAEKVYQFEQEKNLRSDEYFLSLWEECDYTLDNFQNILDKNQFAKFLKEHEDYIKAQEEFLIKSDKEQINFIKYYNELNKYYESKYVPPFYKERFLMQIVSLPSQYKPKVQFLKQEYQAFLDSQKVGLISSHYRHNRLYKPNELKAALLRHRLDYIVPNFQYFKSKMDAPTKVTAQFILDIFQYLVIENESFFKKKEKELNSFLDKIQAKYIGKPKGWHVTTKETEQEISENRVMQVVLMDINKYGC